MGASKGRANLYFTGLPYLAVYRVREHDVEILRILHGAQAWPR
jgi:plasmid stabilization system protein ParE